MTGMQQIGANTILNLGPLALAGTLNGAEGNDNTTLTLNHPLAKARDAVAFGVDDIDQFDQCAFRGVWCTDGQVHFQWADLHGDDVQIDTIARVALLRSPGYPDVVTGIGGSGPGPALPLLPFVAGNAAVGPIASLANDVLTFAIPGGGGQVPGACPIALNGPFGATAGLIIRAWRVVGSALEVGVMNASAAPISVLQDTVTAQGFLVGSRATPFDAQILANSQFWAVQGGAEKGPVKRYAVGQDWPAANNTIPMGGIPATLTCPINAKTPPTMAPDTLRLAAWSLQGMPNGYYGTNQLPLYNAGPFEMINQAVDGAGADVTVVASSLQTYFQTLDTTP